MMRIAYLDCFAGISGDMALGALVDAGVSFELLAETTAALNVGARLEKRSVMRGGLTGTKIDVVIEPATHHHHEHDHAHEHTHSHEASHNHPHDHGHAHAHSHSHDHKHEHSHSHDLNHDHSHSHENAESTKHSHEHEHRSLSAILRIIDASPLNTSVKERSKRAFTLLGEAEAAIHGVSVEEVHFHEVGAVDTIVDIVCAAVGAESLNVSRWYASALNVGSGTVKCAHGILPVPAPATLKLLEKSPVYSAGPAMERITPTGAAILRMLDVQYLPMPTMQVITSGYGVGGRESEGIPNLLRIVIGESSESNHTQGEPIAVIETVIDDCSPQVLGYVSELLLEQGAWDVIRASVQMKKGRNGVQLTVLSHPSKLELLRAIILRETTTIGLHWRIDQKLALDRSFHKVQTEWGEVTIKVARMSDGSETNAAPEYEDCRRIAREHNVALKSVQERSLQAYRNAINPQKDA